jgi:hypothetical protein
VSTHPQLVQPSHPSDPRQCPVYLVPPGQGIAWIKFPRAEPNLARGHQKKPTDPARAFAKSQTHPPTSHQPIFFVVYAFGRFSVRGVQKYHQNIFTLSPSCRKLFPKKSRKLLMSVFPQLFCFLAFSGVYQRWEFKNTTKNILQKKSCRKVCTKQSTKTPHRFFIDFLTTFSGVSR